MTGISAILSGELYALPPLLVEGPALGHIPMFNVVFALSRPRTFLDVGYRKGELSAAAVSASRRSYTETLCYTVSTTPINDGATASLRRISETLYPSLKLLEEDFASALASFPNGSLDLLAVRADDLASIPGVADSIAPKLSDQSICIVLGPLDPASHTSTSFESLFGGRMLMEFPHCFGMKVLGTGTSMPPLLAGLVESWNAEPHFRELLKQQADVMGSLVGLRMQHTPPPDDQVKIAATNLVRRSRAYRALRPLLTKFSGFLELEKAVHWQ